MGARILKSFGFAMDELLGQNYSLDGAFALIEGPVISGLPLGLLPREFQQGTAGPQLELALCPTVKLEL
jgi:hypothetical protein